jgi:preprotein translocase subunit YajC
VLGVFWLLAEAAAEAPAAGGKVGDAGGGNPLAGMLLPLVLIGAMFYFMLLRPEKKKQAEHKLLLESLKKNDRVVTIGGIYGVVANVQREADRVTLKVDEANNTKLDVTFTSIARVITAEPEGKKE